MKEMLSSSVELPLKTKQSKEEGGHCLIRVHKKEIAAL